ncbi:ATP-binding protein [Corynebacterium sp. CCM 8862]|uniref:ATP-binding protein n=1 Tax=Corynebacterium mendelii TaxID=2765362 RepID=A0A939IUH2_9CORY|nr:ATP-binding protein [Corynebacterium mendelii]
MSYPITGIFGANASGKSALLDAILYMFSAIRFSATVWQDGKGVYRAPFALDGTAETSSSFYEIDFVFANHRFCYGFEVDRKGIAREWLKDIPTTRWRTLFHRDREQETFKFHSTVKSTSEVTDRELVLSRALLLKRGKSVLGAVARELVEAFDCVLVTDSYRAHRVAGIIEDLVENNMTFGDLQMLLEIADIGVEGITVEQSDVPEEVRRLLRILDRELGGSATPSDTLDEDTPGGGTGIDTDEKHREQVARRLMLTHRGSVKQCPPFRIEQESDGTIAWLALSVPVLEALRSGGLVIVDEIDASIHPHLLELVLGAFADPEINRKHAQLIFSTHESFVLSPMCEVKLQPEQVWFTDKAVDGATELTCLADFPRHPDANVARRYLAGRYGGTPRLAPSMLLALVDSSLDQ